MTGCHTVKAFGAALALSLTVRDLTVLSHAAPPAPVIQTDVAYGPDPSETLDVCRPVTENQRARAVLLVHGGGWTTGDKHDYLGLCNRIAQRGMVGFAVNYRLVMGPKGPMWPAPLVDVQLAVRWTRAHVVEFGVDPGQVCALGGSAGAQLVVTLASMATIQPGDRQQEFAEISPKIDCAVDIVGPVDFTTWQLPAEFLVRMFGTLTPKALHSAKQKASPLFLIDSHTAPMLIVQGIDDAVVPPEQASRLFTALKQNGVRAALVMVPGDHGLQALPPEQFSAVEELELAFIRTSPVRPH